MVIRFGFAAAVSLSLGAVSWQPSLPPPCLGLFYFFLFFVYMGRWYDVCVVRHYKYKCHWRADSFTIFVPATLELWFHGSRNFQVAASTLHATGSAANCVDLKTSHPPRGVVSNTQADV